MAGAWRRNFLDARVFLQGMKNGKKRVRFITQCIVALLFMTVCDNLSVAQNSIGVPPLGDHHPVPSFGFEFGVGQNSRSGTMVCVCGSAFSGGKGTGLSGSAFFELPAGNDLNIGLKTGYVRENTLTTTPTNEIVVVHHSGAPQDTALLLQESTTGALLLTFLQFEPFVQYRLFKSNFFVQVGAGISVLLSNDLTETRQLPITSSYLFGNGTNSETIQGGHVAEITNPQFSGLLSAGYNFRFGIATIAPIVTYNYPFSTGSNQNGNDWKISTIYGSLALKFNL